MAAKSPEFMRLFIQHRGMISSFILSLIHDPSAAEDLIQEVAINLMEKFDTFDGENFGAWARKVAKWHVLNHWRAESRYRRALSKSALQAVDAQFEANERRFLDWELRKEAMARCMERLEGLPGRIIELRFVQGLGLKEIADRVDKKVGAIQMQIARVKDGLARCVGRRLAASEER